MREALFGWPPPVLDPAGPYASSVTILAWVLFAIGVVVTGIVVLALLVAIRGKPSSKAKLGGEKAVWIAGVAFPAVVLTILLVWGLSLTSKLNSPIAGNELRVRVTGELFWFRVDYLDPLGRVLFSDANEVHIPVGRPVVFELKSADVIHSFWVPNLSGKKDMLPGRTNLLKVEAREAGQYGGVCAEFCGRAHALMGLVVVAEQPDRWQQWMASRQAPRPVAASRGQQLFMDSGCAACHNVRGTQANGLAGPDLTNVGSRRTLGAGILPNNRGTMIGWIGDSQSIKPGNRMPNYDMLPAEDTAAIATWLETLK
ncbi:cytochrome c oxidase subunit II [Sphingomonas sp. LY160]|uniref:cytochrome c oxidase subunit II n=1 Tax=Sphingomonas sp. LY160 TaxID=3095342 RepID=UPI002ADEA6F7|nr:cytochrome c oxidase subunit II [Sphingomonas sp. LY160]MEA1073076.1 cytochrome c oxidase subunit II [Sphingomonas sp. LY160]